MEFSRDGQHTIRCVITEDEILELGFTLDEIVSNGARTQEFMNQIFDLAEQEFETKFEMGIKTVRADILPDHTLSLTFSEHPGTEGMMEHIKDIVNGLLSSIPQKKMEDMKGKMNLADMAGFGQKMEERDADKKQKVSPPEDKEKDADSAKSIEPIKIIALFAFEELETVMRYAKQVKLDHLPFNQLYRFEDAYFLMMDMTGCQESEVRSLSALTDEYSADVFVGSEKRAFIYEHGKCILGERAIEQLREV